VSDISFEEFWKVTWEKDNELEILKNKNSSYDKSVWTAWDKCYEAFSVEKDNDKLCLHLTAYLAHWGMYRGSSFFKNHNYKIHEKVVEILLNYRKSDLVGVQLNKLNDDKIKRISNIYGEVEKAYDVNTDDDVNKDENKNKPTDTLVTKILLGTMACIPAYDSFFKRALSEFKKSDKEVELGINLSVKSETREKAIKQLKDFCSYRNILENENMIKITRRLKRKGFKEMRILDLYFFTYGRYLYSRDPQEANKKEDKRDNRFDYIKDY